MNTHKQKKKFFYLPRKQGAVWLPAYHDSTARQRNSAKSQDGSAAHEAVGPGLPCEDEEVSLLQGRSG